MVEEETDVSDAAVRWIKIRVNSVVSVVDCATASRGMAPEDKRWHALSPQPARTLLCAAVCVRAARTASLDQTARGGRVMWHAER